MLSFLSVCDRGLSSLLHLLVLIASATITLALTGLVITRYFFDLSLGGMHEISLFAAIWLYMSGAILVSRKSEHLVVDFLATSLKSERARALHDLLVAVLTLVIAGFFTRWIWTMFAWGLKRPQMIPILDVPLWWAQAPLAMMAFCALVYGLRDLIRAILRLRAAGKA